MKVLMHCFIFHLTSTVRNSIRISRFAHVIVCGLIWSLEFGELNNHSNNESQTNRWNSFVRAVNSNALFDLRLTSLLRGSWQWNWNFHTRYSKWIDIQSYARYFEDSEYENFTGQLDWLTNPSRSLFRIIFFRNLHKRSNIGTSIWITSYRSCSSCEFRFLESICQTWRWVPGYVNKTMKFDRCNSRFGTIPC